MRVIVIGGTVFIGRAVVAELAAHGHDLCLVHRGDHEPPDLPACVHVHTPRLEMASVRDELLAFRPDAVIDNIAANAAQVKVVCDTLPPDLRYVVTSSIDVYEAYGDLMAGRNTQPVPVDETSPVRAQRYPYRGKDGPPGADDYEKLDVEELYGERGATVLRLPMVYGPHDYQRREEFILRRVRAGRERIPTGSGGWLSSRGSVGDIGAGVRAALESEAAEGEVFNLCEPNAHPEGEWARMIVQAAGSQAEFVRVADDALPEDLGTLGAVGQHLLASSDKARRVFGYASSDVHTSLAASVSWHLANPPADASEDFSADDTALAAAESEGATTHV